MSGRWCLLVVVPLLSAQGAQTEALLPPDLLLLARIKVKMSENLSGLPNYTCTETIERSLRSNPSRRYRLLDTLRVEVALVGGKELFAWPGEKNFREKDLSDMITGGAIGNGNFALHARSVFLSNAAEFTYVGPRTRDGRDTVRYDYSVPLSQSGFQLRVGRAKGSVGYRGAFWVDAASLDLARLEVEAIDIPPHIPLASASDAMEYERAQIGDHDYLLPKSSELVLIDLQGNESRNRVQFDNCRQYTGESTLIFDEAPLGPPNQPARAEEVILPGDLEVEATLLDAIPLDRAAVGDRLEARVKKDAKQNRKVIVPKGAKAFCRISLLHPDPRGNVTFVGLELTELEWTGVHAEVRAHLIDSTPFAVLESWDLLHRRDGRLSGRPEVPRDTRNVFLVIGSGRRTVSGLSTVWRIETVPKEK